MNTKEEKGLFKLKGIEANGNKLAMNKFRLEVRIGFLVAGAGGTRTNSF